MTQWSFNPILNSYTAVALLTLAMALLLVVVPSYRRLSGRRRGLLLAVRGAVILLLAVGMLRPTLISTSSEPQSATLLILFDVTRSMSLPGSAGGQTRWEAQRKALEAIQSDLVELSEDIEIKLYGYDQRLQAVELGADGIAFPQVLGDQTDLGTTLHEAVQRELGKRLVGIIVLGDGAQTAFAPKVEVQQAVREIARMDYPLYTVVFGPVGDAAQSRDVIVENLPEQYTVFVKNEQLVKGTLRVRGYVNKAIPVELVVEDTAGQTRTIGPLSLSAREDGEQVPVELTYVPQRPGQYKLTLRAAEQPGELVTRNNELSAFVTVLEGGLRTLYLYGDLLGEQRLLRKSIDASPDIQMDSLFFNPLNRDGVPEALDELKEAKFDVVLIENVDSSALGEPNLRALAAAVEQGKGLMMIGGYNSFGPGGYQGTPLADVPPITMGRFERQDLDFQQPISRDLHLWGKLQMLPTQDHSITRLAAGDENEQLWKTLPPLIGANKFGVKPAAQLLAATPDGQPLLVAGQFGSGRVLAFAGNTTIRWWQYGRQSEHWRFWRQAILWLASREDLAKHDVWIKLDQRRYNPGSRVTFTAGAKSPTGDVIRDANFRAEIIASGGERQTVQLSADGDEYVGTIAEIEQPGDYLVELSVTKDGRPLGTARTNLQVLDRDVELSNPAADYDLMARLANQTKESGGEPLAAEQLPALMRELKERRDELEIEVQSKWQLGDTALDAWTMLLLLIGLLTTEWVLRKKWGLV